MITQEILKNGKLQLSVFTMTGWIRHVFDNIEHLEKYEKKCYPVDNGV